MRKGETPLISKLTGLDVRALFTVVRDQGCSAQTVLIFALICVNFKVNEINDLALN
jgi:hypothetical protein